MPERHQRYVDAIIDVLHHDADVRVRMIALTGQFGTGKSSVIHGLHGQQKIAAIKPVSISLETVAAVRIPERPDSDTAARPTAAARDATTSTPPGRTNLIQKEIVKQLLYSQKPKDAPLSRYRRLTPPAGDSSPPRCS